MATLRTSPRMEIPLSKPNSEVKSESSESFNFIEKLGYSGKIVPIEEQKNSKYENHIFEFSNQTEDRGYPWRSCILEGQLPHFLYWPI